jgi:hypothetical protein
LLLLIRLTGHRSRRASRGIEPASAYRMAQLYNERRNKSETTKSALINIFCTKVHAQRPKHARCQPGRL